MDNKKSSSQLMISDFIAYPLWTWEDDGDNVIPIINHEKIPDEHDAVFAKCEIVMRDGTKIDGVVSVRISNYEAYLISFPEESGKLLDIPLQPLLSEQKDLQLKKLCKLFNKRLDNIFPLEFNTPFKLSNGTLLKGKINI